MKRICFILFLISSVWGQGYYGGLGYRISKVKDPINLKYVDQGFNDLGPDYTTKIETNNSWILSTGFKGLSSSNSFGSTFYNIFGSLHFNKFSYEGYDYGKIGSGNVDWWDWSFGAGYGIKLKSGITISADFDYNLALSNDEVIFDEMPSGAFPTINISFGYMNSNNGIHTGFFASQIKGDHFLTSEGPSFGSNQFTFEFPLAIFMLAIPLGTIASEIDEYSEEKNIDYHWDQFYNEYGSLIWRCRTDGGPNSGQFAPNSKCAGKVKVDTRWPAKSAEN